MGLLNGIQEAMKNELNEETQELVTDNINDGAWELVAEVGVDALFNSLPLLGPTLSTYNNKKVERNLKKLMGELQHKIDDIQENVKNKSERDKEIIDDIVYKAVNSAIKSDQQEKIKFIVNGLESILKNDDISYDIASLYFDTIDRLTLLDIAALQHFRNPMDMETGQVRDVQTILNKFNITLEIFQATRSNLRTYGLLETKTDKKVSDDLSNVYKAITELSNRVNELTTAVKDPKKIKRVKTTDVKPKKIQSKDSYIISEFGRNFIDYFVEVK